MTTIHEMDEFFNFEDAAHPADHLESVEHSTPTPYDLDLALAELAQAEDPFAQVNSYVEALPQDEMNFEFPDSVDDSVDYTDFPRWIDGMDVPTRPCEYCSQRLIHCKVIREGTRKGSCTSCVALAKTCSLTADLRSPIAQIDRFPVAFTAEDKHQESSSRDLDPHSHSGSASDLTALRYSRENLAEAVENSNPKVGARFSREALRVLRAWLTSNHRHPYPSDEEKESLVRQTGLNKTQITNWLANARRRGKVRAPRSTSPSPHQYANGMDIPRRGTPAMKEMNPMERWAHSPPEHEPASVTAIAKAVSTSTFSSGRDSPLTSYGHTDDGSARSISHVSSTSSVGTSASSNGSFASAYSHKSRGSFGSFNSFGNRGRRRRRRQGPRAISPTTMRAPVRTYQCTFCTETFKTKHDWQRHEKSLHLSLERWICSPDGPTKFSVEWNRLSCVYCGLPNPTPEHAEEHNHSSCAERSLEERTFYRKDHLRQHLNLVHDVKFQNWSMDSWKVATPAIRSRCGFCGIIMDSWSIRVEHLAEHFKGGKSMADWKGDWGFEEQVLGIVENGMPPYLIHDERNSPNPYAATRSDVQLGKSLADHVKLWLVDFINDRVATGVTPTDDDLLIEAQRVVRKADTEDKSPQGPEVSWFRDLIILSRPSRETTVESGNSGGQGTSTSTRAWDIQLEKINNQTPSDRDLSLIRCLKEKALVEYVKSRQALGLTPPDSELQVQCCKIIDDVEPKSNFKCKGAVQWFKYLITASTGWLAEFRRRACLPRSSELAYEDIRSTDDKTIDYSIHNSYRLQRELKDWVQLQRAVGKMPSDEEIQRQARLIIYGNDDAWNQTVLDDMSNLNAFKRQNGLAPSYDGGLPMLPEVGESPPSNGSQTASGSSPRILHWDLVDRGIGLPSPLSGSDRPAISPFDQPLYSMAQNQPSCNTNPVQPLRYFLNDANCYGRLEKELTRFVMSCLSPNNPLQHIPSDAEIQNQARWVIYDDDDPWNQTAADNAEWLTRFKRDVGLSPADEGPGLPPVGSPRPWTVKDGGSGFYPPYVKPKEGRVLAFNDDVPVSVDNRMYSVRKETAVRYLRDLNTGRYQAPASVFCARELEDGLNAYVEDCIMNRQIPTDDELRAKAREILGVEHTAADEPKLLARFKAMHVLWRSQRDSDGEDEKITPGQQPDYSLPNFTGDVNMFAAFDQQLDTMDLSTDFSAGLTGPAGGSGHREGASGDEAFEMEKDFNAQMEFEKIIGLSRSTSSSLRRKASEQLAEASGFAKPVGKGGGA